MPETQKWKNCGLQRKSDSRVWKTKGRKRNRERGVERTEGMNVEIIRNVVGNGIQSSRPVPAHLVILVMLLFGQQPLGYSQPTSTVAFSELFTFTMWLLHSLYLGSTQEVGRRSGCSWCWALAALQARWVLGDSDGRVLKVGALEAEE